MSRLERISVEPNKDGAVGFSVLAPMTLDREVDWASKPAASGKMADGAGDGPCSRDVHPCNRARVGISAVVLVVTAYSGAQASVDLGVWKYVPKSSDGSRGLLAAAAERSSVFQKKGF